MAETPPENWSKGRPFKSTLGYFFAALLAAVVSVCLYSGAQYFAAKRTNQGALDNPALAQPPVNKPAAEGGMNQLKKTSESFRFVAKKVGPAVVNVKSTRGLKSKAKLAKRKGFRSSPQPQDDDDNPLEGQDPFFEFFRRFGQPFRGAPQEPQTSLGSGILIDKKGTVVTNNHVVDDASEILVTLDGDNTELKAKVVGTDAKTDLAVLKIETGGDFPVADWADSDAVEVGDWAIAIGSPFALGQSVTVGIVSAKGRNAQGLGSEYGGDLIQTDAAINPGNSGGPLCDLEGRVMGVNTAIYTRSGGYMGIGFAIPSNLAKDVVGKLISDGKIIRGWLGVYIQPLDPDLAKELGIKDGVGVHEVIQDSPAAKAGLTAGDVIIEVDGKAVKEVTSLQKTIGNYKPNQRVKIRVVSYADKKTRNLNVKIGTLPDNEAQAKEGKEEEPDRLGLLLSPVQGGISVDAVQPGSLAEQALGLEQGDIVTHLDRTPVNSVSMYNKLMNAKKRHTLSVKRKGRALFFQFVLPD
jgi:serine protease Do